MNFERLFVVWQFCIVVGFFLSGYAGAVALVMLFTGWTAPGDHPVIFVLVLLALSVGTVLWLVARQGKEEEW